MAEFQVTVEPPEEGDGLQFVVQEENEVSVMLANALKKMDGLIGDYRRVQPELPSSVTQVASTSYVHEYR